MRPPATSRLPDGPALPMLDRPMRPTRREILASLAAASFVWRAGVGETMKIVPFQIPWDPKGLGVRRPGTLHRRGGVIDHQRRKRRLKPHLKLTPRSCPSWIGE